MKARAHSSGLTEDNTLENGKTESNMESALILARMDSRRLVSGPRDIRLGGSATKKGKNNKVLETNIEIVF